MKIRLRLPKALGDRVLAQAEEQGTTIRVVLRSAIASGLRHRSAIVDAPRAKRGGPTYEIGGLPLPRGVVLELRDVGKKLGVSVNEAVRRAVEAGLRS